MPASSQYYHQELLPALRGHGPLLHMSLPHITNLKRIFSYSSSASARQY